MGGEQIRQRSASVRTVFCLDVAMHFVFRMNGLLTEGKKKKGVLGQMKLFSNLH